MHLAPSILELELMPMQGFHSAPPLVTSKPGIGHYPCVLYWAVPHDWAKPASPEEAPKVYPESIWTYLPNIGALIMRIG